MHRGRPVESGSTVPRFHTELVPCVNKRYHRSLYRPQPPPTHQCPLYNDCKHSVPSAHPRNHPDGAVPWNRGTGTGTTVPVPNCAQARVSLGDPVPTTTPPTPPHSPPTHPPTSVLCVTIASTRYPPRTHAEPPPPARYRSMELEPVPWYQFQSALKHAAPWAAVRGRECWASSRGPGRSHALA